MRDVTDRDCPGRVELVSFDHATIVGHCAANEGHQVLTVTVANGAEADVGTLKWFDLEFCSASIAGVTGPRGWTATVQSGGRGVRWSRGGREFNEPGVEAGQSLSGFAITLKQGWRLAQSSTVVWDDVTEGHQTLHDCQ
ncbi:MAG: hypothetical protein AB7U83_05885 [Vicinamibacterales bacterium]